LKKLTIKKLFLLILTINESQISLGLSFSWGNNKSYFLEIEKYELPLLLIAEFIFNNIMNIILLDLILKQIKLLKKCGINI
jgi:hypothetical protein